MEQITINIQTQETKATAAANERRYTVTLDKDGNVSNYKYQVVFVDEYNNWYLIGFFNNLLDAESELNSYLEGYEVQNEETGEIFEPMFGDGDAPLGHLREYPSSFSNCFDMIVDTTCGCVQIRGFIFE